MLAIKEYLQMMRFDPVRSYKLQFKVSEHTQNSLLVLNRSNKFCRPEVVRLMQTEARVEGRKFLSSKDK